MEYAVPLRHLDEKHMHCRINTGRKQYIKVRI